MSKASTPAKTSTSKARMNDLAEVFVMYNGEWKIAADGARSFYAKSCKTLDIPKNTTFSKLVDMIYHKINVQKSTHDLLIEVNYDFPPNLPPVVIDKDDDLGTYLSRLISGRTSLPLCVSLVEKSRITYPSQDKSTTRNTSPEMASMGQRKADENVLRLVEEQKKEKQEALNMVLQLERQIVAKQKLEMEIEEMNEELQQKQEEMSCLEDLNRSLTIKERQCNDELQEARKELIMGMADMFNARSLIGIKRMGDIDIKTFHAACKKIYQPSAAEMKSSELCTFWQEKLRQPEWHPFKVIETEDGNYEQIIDENDEELKTLREEWGNDAYEAVGTALKEMNEYNASGSYVVSELWNFKENRKATLKEGVLHCLKSLKSLKRKRT